MKKILLFTVLTLFITGLILLVIERNDKFTDYIDNIEIVPLSKEELVYSYNFKPIEQFKPSSCSIQPYGKGYIMNIRYINYSFNKEGIIYYHYPDKVCKTKNVYVEQKQTRSADEGITSFYNCLNCMASWKN